MQNEELEQMKKLNPVTRHDLEEEEEKKKFLQGEESEPSPVKHKH